MKDITGMSPPSKPVVRYDSKGYRAKVWYRNGAGTMLWRWWFYFTDPADTVEGALEAGRAAEAKAKEDVARQAELDRAMWAAIGAMSKKDREWRNNRQ